jgi:uncharacterized protein
MKTSSFVLFFSIVLTVYGLVNFYFFSRGWQALPAGSPARVVYLVAFLFLALAFIAGRVLERIWLNPVTEALVWIGSFWLAAMLYFFLAALCVDVLRAVNSLFPIYPRFITDAYAAAKVWTLAGVVVAVSFILAIGHINASHPRVRDVAITISKNAGGAASMTVVAASDIHLGTIIGREHFSAIVQKINDLDPDLILLPGDIVDEDLGPVIREDLGEQLRLLRARYGVFAITGNHEYIGGADAAVAYLTEHGITVLRDSVVRVGPGLTLVGREDRSITQFSGRKRKPLEEIMAGVDRSSPIILLDHQPFGLDEAVRGGVDLQISGHTHHGQLWPLNLITNAIYEVSWGYLYRDETHFYVSSGAGTWGPPVRTGNTPEIVRFAIQFGGPAGRSSPD